IVLEKHLTWPPIHRGINYVVDEFPWDSEHLQHGHLARVIKVHGSANWVYCDNCRQVYFDPTSKLSLDINAGLVDDDFKLFDELWPAGRIRELTGIVNRDCIRCRSL